MRYCYQQFQPIDAFRHLVDAYWTNRPAANGATLDRVLPDGCIDLIYRSGPDGGRLFASALIERPAVFGPARPGWYAGVRFRPAMARPILDIEPAACRDRDIPALLIDPRFAALEERLRGCASADAALVLLRRAVDTRLAADKRDAAPTRVRAAIALLAQGRDDPGGEPEVWSVARQLGIAERSLQRDLVRWSGLKPKSLARILRMQRTLAAIRAGRAPLAELALRMGYADQAHMTRELKALTGFTPARARAAARTHRCPKSSRRGLSAHPMSRASC